MEQVKFKIEMIEKTKVILSSLSIEPEEINPLLNSVQSSPLVNRQKVLSLLLRPNIGLADMINYVPKIKEALAGMKPEILEQVEIQTKYETYIEKERELVAKMSQLEDLLIPDNFSYDKLVSLSNEARQKFTKIRPRTLGQASRISGVNPSDVQILMVFMGI